MKRKKSYSERKSSKLLWPMSAKSDKKNLFIQKEKKHKVSMALFEMSTLKFVHWENFSEKKNA